MTTNTPKQNSSAKKTRQTKKESQATEQNQWVPFSDEALAKLGPVGDFLVLTGDRAQELFEDAVRRGRMTRSDAEELLQNLVEIGREQAKEFVDDVEQIVERGKTNFEQVAENARSQVKTATTKARRVPATDKLLQQVDRARRVAGIGSTFPIIGYETLTATQVTQRLSELSSAELRAVRDFERTNAARKTVLRAIESRLTA